MTERPSLVSHRNEGKDAAILFVHGYSGHPETTWGRFPGLLVAESRLDGWDVFSVGYHTSLAPDVLRGIWKARPALATLGDMMRTVCGLPPLDRYGALAVVAHSMGGLVAQHAVLEPAYRCRVRHLFLFGTPSGGLAKASLFAVLQRQLRDMGKRSRFILELRRRWTEEIGAEPPFGFWPVAGDEDEFVGRESSVDVFAGPPRSIPGDHLSIVKPRTAEAPAVRLVVQAITTGAAAAGPLEAARRAVEQGRFQEVIRSFEGHAAELDEDALVVLALALDGVGRRADAVRLLEERGERAGTDVLGTLGGRIKRRWVGERRQADGELARTLYARGYERAAAAGDDEQAYYHAINVAFLELCFHRDRDAARRWAERARGHCLRDRERAEARGGADPGELWRTATDAEACLVGGDSAAALDAYSRMLALEPQPWQALSTYWQARMVADRLGDRAAADALDRLFCMEDPP